MYSTTDYGGLYFWQIRIRLNVNTEIIKKWYWTREREGVSSKELICLSQAECLFCRTKHLRRYYYWLLIIINSWMKNDETWLPAWFEYFLEGRKSSPQLMAVDYVCVFASIKIGFWVESRQRLATHTYHNVIDICQFTRIHATQIHLIKSPSCCSIMAQVSRIAVWIKSDCSLFVFGTHSTRWTGTEDIVGVATSRVDLRHRRTLFTLMHGTCIA